MMSGVEVMKNFVVQVIRACCKKKNTWGLFPNLILEFSKIKEPIWFMLLATTFSQHLLQHSHNICYNMFQFHVKIIKELVFCFILYLLLFNDSLKNEKLFFVNNFFIDS
jgi:hypothetical protein